MFSTYRYRKIYRDEERQDFRDDQDRVREALPESIDVLLRPGCSVQAFNGGLYKMQVHDTWNLDRYESDEIIVNVLRTRHDLKPEFYENLEKILGEPQTEEFKSGVFLPIETL